MHRDLWEEIFDLMQEPKELAVIKCIGHSKQNDWEAKGNEAADKAAKRAAGYDLTAHHYVVTPVGPQLTREAIIQEQERATDAEREEWREAGAEKARTGLWHKERKPVLPPSLKETVLTEIHTHCHIGPEPMWQKIKRF